MEQIVSNKEVILASFANEGPVTEEHIKVREAQFNINQCTEGEVVVQNMWVSVDPYLRWLMKYSNRTFNLDGFKLNQPISSLAVGTVVASAHSGFQAGDIVTGYYHTAQYSRVAGSGLRKIDTSVGKPSDYLGYLGHVGLTAWTGFVLVGDPKAGEEVFVTAAAGAVGLLVGQLAKIKGCRVVGSAGSDQKVKLLKDEFGFDDAFNYKAETDWDAALSRYFPKGIDIYFDNVGGAMLEAVLNHINMNGRIPLCGMISQYNKHWEKSYGVKNLMHVVERCVKMQGFLSNQFWQYVEEFVKEMYGYVKEGKIKYMEDVTQGIENFHEAFNSLFSGENIGKVLVQVTNS